MADVKARIAPFINKRFLITSTFGEDRGTYKHCGIDLATGGKDPLYSVLDGTVLQKGYDPDGAGYWIVVKGTNNIGYIYEHMDQPSPLEIGTTVAINDYIGIEGSTGDSTGYHVDFRLQDMTNTNTWKWSRNPSDYLDPASFLGIPNTKGVWCIYDGTPGPTPPTPPEPGPIYKRDKFFPWVLYARKFRQKRRSI